MSILTFPTLSKAPTTCRFSLMPNTQMFESPLNRTVQTVELPGARWTFEMEFQSLTLADARIIKAFFAQLRGMAGRFYMGDYSHKTPAGTAYGHGIVSGTGQAGNTLITSGWDPSQAALFMPGDYIGINSELKIITQTCMSDATGQSELVFEPPIRYSPADVTAIVVVSPSCVMRLADDEQDQFTIDPERRPTVSFTGMEVFA